MIVNSGLVQWRLLGVLGISLTAGFFLTKAVIGPAEPSSKLGGVDTAMLQARRLMDELQARDFDSSDIDMDLLRLPEQDYASLPSRRAPDSRSFVIPFNFSEYEEVAFVCDTFVRRDLEIVQGIEGVATTTGFYIVGWKSGAINTYDVTDVRLYNLPSNPRSMIPVFPGMGEYRPELRLLSGVRPQSSAAGG